MDLFKLLEKLGHFKYHRRGGKIGQERILKLLSSKTEMTQKQVQDYLEIQSGSMSEIVGKLEGKGLITKQKDESDKRKIILRITEEGHNVLETANSEVAIQEENLFKALDEQEQADLQRIVSKLLLSWEENYVVNPKKQKRKSQHCDHTKNNKEHNNELYRRKKVDRA